MRAIVTGANGFIGSHLAHRLAREGLEVACLVRPAADVKWLQGLGVEVVRVCMEEGESLARALTEMGGADIIFHVAGLTRGRTEQEYTAVNVDLTRRLMQAAAPCAGRIRRFIYVSSMAAVGPNPTDAPMDEATPPRPVDHYGRSKLAAERVVMEAGGRIPVTIVRPPAVYGPRDVHFVPLFRMAQRWGIVPAVGGRDKRITFVHAADLAEGVWLAGTRPEGAGQTYFIGGGTCTMEDVAAAMSAAIGRQLRVFHVPKAYALLVGEFGQLKWALTGRPQIVSRAKARDLLRPRWTCCWDKACRELGYVPRIGLEEGMRQTAAWYAQQGWIRPLCA
ncbi:MAG: NAD-dependent epimerase/dehydratase family protein [Phycisphaerae bacterium]